MRTFLTLLAFGLIYGPTSLLAQEIETPANASWIPVKNCWCVSTEELAKATFALKTAKEYIRLKDEEMKAKVSACEGTCKEQMQILRTAGYEQVQLLQDNCSKQTTFLINQSSDTIKKLNFATAEQMKEMSKSSVSTPWYQSPTLWGVVGVVAGVGGTLLILETR